MYLKALEMLGFKSFPDKIRLELGKGMTAVVGPNGSGKSNISDAIRWVLGEQSTKTLRGSKMEDIIFNGTVNRRAHGFVDVRLVIDNSDRGLQWEADEVVISRKYYRSGESEYRINGTAVRLRDITELLMDTGLGRDGYSVIGQGRISEIVGAKPLQRREIFEEAAGISKFRYRREEAEKRLAQAEDNLLRLKDILAEVESRVEPLRKQSETAERFLKLSEEKKLLEVSLWMNSIDKARGSLREQEDKILLCKGDYDEIDAHCREIEDEIDRVFGEMQQIAADIESKREAIRDFEERSAGLASEKAVLLNDIRHDEESIERVEREIDEVKSSADATEQQKKNLEERIGRKQEERRGAIERLNAQNAQTAQMAEQRGRLAGELAGFERDSAGLVTEYNGANLERARAQSDIAQLESRKQLLEQSLADREERVRQLEGERQECEGLLEEIGERMTSLSNTAKGIEMKLSGRQNQLEKLDAEIAKLRRGKDERLSRAKLLEDMERSMEGFMGSVKFVLGQAQRGYLRGIHGTVSEKIDVDAEQALAIETALGAAMQNIITENEEVAKRAVGELKRSNMGRATFLSITSVRGSRLNERGIEEQSGFVGVAADLVHRDAKYDGIVLNLLGRTVVVETLDDAVDMARKYSYRFRIVTLDGQVINSGGSITGGSSVKNAGILSRKSEINRLRAEAQELDGKIEAAMKPYNAAKEESVRLGAALVAAQSEYKTCSEDRIRYDAELRRIAQLLEDAGRSGEENERQRKGVAEALKKANEMKAACEETLSRLQYRIDEIDARREELRQKDERLKEAVGEARSAESELTIAIAGIEKDIELLRLSEEQLERQSDDRAARIAALERQTADYRRHIDETKGRIERNRIAALELEQSAGEGKKLIEQAAQSRLELEAKTTQMRARQKEDLERREQVSRELVRLEERRNAAQSEYDSLIRRLWEEYGLTRAQAEEFAQELESVSAAQKRLAEVRGAIKALGTVNLSAIEEYKEVSARYVFLKGQLEDVERSRDEIRELISQLTTQMRSVFSEKFAVIAENFTRIFAELFEGGSGKLVLTDNADVLEAGIDISVQPPGKIINNLAALSGGEQSMVAIAIYFAILKASPAPFCILDEIDAALDDVNVTRYSSYLRRLEDRTQFIAITHRRGTMEAADVLYGVTMQEVGVSKVLKLDVSEVESKLGITADAK